MSERKHMLLFLGQGPDGLHVVCGALAAKHDGARVVCCAIQACEPDAVALQAMQEAGVDVSSVVARSPEDIELFSFDLVVTLGDFDAACRPNLPGMPPHVHWDVELAPIGAPSSVQLEGLRRAFQEVQSRVETLFASGMMSTLSIARRNLELVLDNLAQGVMAHTISRRIFLFNRAAERITGRKREELLGEDCHQVFAMQRFCGGECLFCGQDRPRARGCIQPRTQNVPHTRPDGQNQILEMTITPLSDATGVPVGALLSFQDVTELHALKRRVGHHHVLGNLVARDPKMLDLFDQIREVASAHASVLIEGESGTGKELIAQAIHAHSPRADKAFVPVNCGALPEGVLESELFGHVRGAFTGAVQDKRGRFEMANGGTLFLDEVAELSASMQVKLLRVLQERCFERVGGERSIHVDIRVVSATNQNLRKLMDRGLFRRDLYYRLCVIPIHAPPLRQRTMDIPVLVDHFLTETSDSAKGGSIAPSNEALDALMRYAWPGNVRELRNVIEYVRVKCRTGLFGVEHLPREIGYPRRETGRPGPVPKLDRAKVEEALVRAAGNRAEAAKLLGVGRTTLYRYLTAFGLT